MRALCLAFGLLALAPSGRVEAQISECRVVDVKFTPAPPEPSTERREQSQIVVWLEKPDGTYLDTLFITAQTGRFGLGNRPGRFDFNAGPMFPYGRRITTFPVWGHRHGKTFPAVVFQNCCRSETEITDDPDFCFGLINDPSKEFPWDREHRECGENNLSHPFQQSSLEKHYCQPLQPTDSRWAQADAMTCATSNGAYTDKGKFSTTGTSVYPPRVDLIRTGVDSPSVDMYRAMNPFDAVSFATPPAGNGAKITWPIPDDLPAGDYVVWVEVAQAFDHNATYSVTNYPPPSATGEKAIDWSAYGMPYRGQPSIVYKVPFSIGTIASSSSTQTYVGYGDPMGKDGTLRAPDATITSDTPGTGASRLQLVSEDGTMYRVLVTARPERDYALPGQPDAAEVSTIGPTTATIRFAAPGDDGVIGKVTGYEIRYFANQELTADNFVDANEALATVIPGEPGTLQTVDLMGLLPETDYWVGIRAHDDCLNQSAITIVKFTTADRVVGEVDACFVATAAYGTQLANEVEMLRRFRDVLMKQTVFGELAIESYYTFGPALAGVVGESELLRSTVRAFLAPIVAWVRELRF